MPYYFSASSPETTCVFQSVLLQGQTCDAVGPRGLRATVPSAPGVLFTHLGDADELRLVWECDREFAVHSGDKMPAHGANLLETRHFKKRIRYCHRYAAVHSAKSKMLCAHAGRWSPSCA